MENVIFEGEWAQFLKELDYNRQDILKIIGELVPEDNTDQKVLRLLSQGKSGAGVFLLSYIENGRDLHYVIKIVSADNPELLKKEQDALNKYVRRIYPNIRAVVLDNAIAYEFYIKPSNNLFSYILSPNTQNDIARAVERIFRTLGYWYKESGKELLGFFCKYTFDGNLPDVAEIWPDCETLPDMWERLKNKWPIARGIIKSICHGDLNQTNILIDDPGEIKLIDFASTSEQHFAYDFARLERQLKYLAGDELEYVSDIVDRAYDFEVPHTDTFANKIVCAIHEIRRQAEIYFKHSFELEFQDYAFPAFEQEYFIMLAFQQICIFNSRAWVLSETQRKLFSNSLHSLLKLLLEQEYKPFAFGYLYVEEDGFERILLKLNKEKHEWFFPVASFIDFERDVKETLYELVENLLAQTGLDREFIRCGFEDIIIIDPIIKEQELLTLHHQGITCLIKPVFFKVKLQKLMEIKANNYKWAKKIKAFKGSLVIDDTSYICGHENLQKIIRHDYVTKEYGKSILQCVDILIFKEDPDGCKFLLLRRQNPNEDYGGWEYPKGGLEYHETIHEGAVRELLEETGIEFIGDFRLGGYLGCQTVDVAWRNRPNYDTLRVHGMTYLFVGNDKEIKPCIGEYLLDFGWFTYHEASENTWIREYAKEFFTAWKNNKYSILKEIARPLSIAFQITESCGVGCRFCHRCIRHENGLQNEEIFEIIDMLSARGIMRLTITGGEPLELGTDRVFEIIRYAHSKRIHTCLSSTGITMRRADFVRFESVLDCFLASLHAVDEDTGAKLYRTPGRWKEIYNKVNSILEWASGRKIIIGIITCVNKYNYEKLLDIGKWLFSINENIFWRIEEYYANGRQDQSCRDEFESDKNALNQQIDKVIDSPELSEYYKSGRIRIDRNDSRAVAPDIMITPDGNLVTTAGNKYTYKSDKKALLCWEFKNRRPSQEYSYYCREDWDW